MERVGLGWSTDGWFKAWGISLAFNLIPSAAAETFNMICTYNKKCSLEDQAAVTMNHSAVIWTDLQVRTSSLSAQLSAQQCNKCLHDITLPVHHNDMALCCQPKDSWYGLSNSLVTRCH